MLLPDKVASTAKPREFWMEACTQLEYAWGKPGIQGSLKSSAEDFYVEEQLGFAPDGKGEHLFLYVEKIALNTTEVQQLLAQHFRLPLQRVAFSGMKDKQAVCRQWFSVQTDKDFEPGQPLASSTVQVLSAARNSRKLRRGSHRSNKFRLRIRHLDGDRAGLEHKLQILFKEGVPNYFGPQRFGYGCNTLLQAVDWFEGRTPVKYGNTRSLVYSAARALLFNQVLSARVADNTWNRAIDGDLMALAGTASVFAADRASTDELQQRLATMDIHPTGPLWGIGLPVTTGAAAQLEQEVLAPFRVLSAGLEQAGLEQDRRPLRLQILDLHHAFENDALLLGFTLGKGSYATAFVRELLQTD